MTPTPGPSLAEAILASMTEGLIVSDMTGTVLEMNPAALGLFGFQNVAEAQYHLRNPQEAFELRSSEGAPIPAAQWPTARVLAGETFTNHQVQIRRQDTGKEWWGNFGGSIIRDDAGRPVRMILTVQDISALKRADRELRYVTTHARCLLWFGTVRRYDDGGFAWKTQVFDEAAAQAFCPLEVRPDESYTDAWYRHRLPEGKWLTDTVSVRAFQEGLTDYSTEFGCEGSDGVVRWFSEQINIEPYTNEAEPADPRIIDRWRVVGVSTDVSDRRRVELALQETVLRQRNFLRDVLASVTEGRLQLCTSLEDLPPALTPISEGIPLTSSSGLGDLRRATQQAAIDLGFRDERWHDLMIAVGEAGMNAVVHAGGGHGQVATDGRDTVQVRVVDEGRGIAVEDLPHAALQKGYTTAGTLGHGMKMVLQTADRVWLLTGPSGTTVVLEQDRVAPVPMFPW